MAYQSQNELRRSIHPKHTLLQEERSVADIVPDLHFRHDTIEDALMLTAILAEMTDSEGSHSVHYLRTLAGRLNECALMIASVINELSQYSKTNHTHTKSQITDFAHTHTKADIIDFAHTHTKSQITDFAHTHTKADITDFAHTHSEYALTSHTHTKADITDFAHTHSEYLTSYTETDPTVPSHVKTIASTDIGHWNTAYGWGNHAGLYALVNHVHSGYVLDTDARLSDARTPTAHNHDGSQITTGTISYLRLPIGTQANQVASGNHAHSNYVETTDARLSDARTPTSHTHTRSHITDFAHTHSANELPVYGTVPIGYDFGAGLVPQGDSLATAKFLCSDSTWKTIDWTSVENKPTVFAKTYSASDNTSYGNSVNNVGLVPSGSRTGKKILRDDGLWIDVEEILTAESLDTSYAPYATFSACSAHKTGKTVSFFCVFNIDTQGSAFSNLGWFGYARFDSISPITGSTIGTTTTAIIGGKLVIVRLSSDVLYQYRSGAYYHTFPMQILTHDGSTFNGTTNVEMQITCII